MVPSSLESGTDESARESRFRGWLIFKAHRLVYHSTLGLRVIKKKKKPESQAQEEVVR